jgi:Domain of unknown function (DUF4476)
MKKILIVIILIGAAGATALAQTMLKVRMADNTPINVSVDGRYFNKTGTSVTVGDLPFGRHYFKIYAKTQTRSGRTYDEVVYQGKIKTYYGRITSIVYDPYTGGLDIQEQDIDNFVNEHQAPNAGNGQYVENGSTSNNEKSYYPGNNGYTPAETPAASPAPLDAVSSLTDEKINKLKTKVSAKKTDTDKMNLIKAGLKEETLTTAQVGMLMDWLNFESSKVEFAEWAYNFTVDQQSYADLLAKLNFQNYRDELDKFLKAQK